MIEFLIVAWLVLSIVGFLLSLILIREARKDLLAVEYYDKQELELTFLRRIADMHLKQEILSMSQMVLAMVIGILAVTEVVAGEWVILLLVILLVDLIGKGAYRLFWRRRLLEIS